MQRPIIQAGISCVVYESDKYDGTEGNIASKRMFHEAGVKLVQLPYEIDVETKSVSVKSSNWMAFYFKSKRCKQMKIV